MQASPSLIHTGFTVSSEAVWINWIYIYIFFFFMLSLSFSINHLPVEIITLRVHSGFLVFRNLGTEVRSPQDLL